MTYKLGSLFSGSGGFELAGSMCDIEPVWAAEVEPYPVAVTRRRFPKMKHLGDVSKVNGGEIEPVDIITFGSPCQDMSVAGKRAGLKHEDNGDDETTRSGLFMEAIRIIKEMREATNGRYPAFALWENVPGAFSSNKGEDFRCVLQSLIQIVEPGAVVPDVPKGGWAYADWFMGCGWSLAYRVLDAQYWGVPQRRRRIYLVLDLRGERAGKILFEREGLRGYFAQSGAAWQATAGDAEGGVGADDRAGEDAGNCLTPWDYQGKRCYNADGVFPTLFSGENSGQNQQSVCIPCTLEPGIAAREGGHIYEGVSGTLRANAGDNQMAVAHPVPNILLDDQGGSQISVRTDGKSPTLRAEMHGNVPCVLDVEGLDGYNSTTTGDKSSTLGVNCGMSTGRNGVIIAVPASTKEQHLFENHSQDARYRGPLDVCPMLPAQLGTGGNNQPFVVEEQKPVAFSFDSLASNSMKSSNPHSGCRQVEVAKTLDTTDPNPSKNQGGIAVVEQQPVYCLQGNTIDRPAVAYSIGNGQLNQISMSETCNTLDCMHDKQAVLVAGKEACAGVDCRNLAESPELYPTLQAKPNGGQSLNYSGAVRVRYIVRRLTPTECARLQGFPDKWGRPNWISEDTRGEVAEFWHGVYMTDCTIKGKKPKPIIAEKRSGWEVAVVRWHNRLHADSAEYKMWGNGIALPCALYVMQGIEDALKEESKWIF